MNNKKIILFIAILVIMISSVGIASAGWFDFLTGVSSDDVSTPEGAEIVKMPKSDNSIYT